MRRVWIVALALAVPTLAGFECTITGGGDMVPGDACAYWLDWDDSYCTAGGANIVYCGDDDWVYEADCASWCPSGAGSCGTDAAGVQACICDTVTCDASIDDSYNTCSGDFLSYCDWSTGSWESYDCTAACGAGEVGRCGYDGGVYACICEGGWQWAAGYGCQYIYDYSAGTCAGNNLTYCADDNIIYEVDCDAHCMDNFAADTGSCGVLPEGGYNGCVCEWATCTWEPYCYDAQFLLMCDATDGSTIWWDCNADCVGQGYSKGACETSGCACI
jgi:hypothetical protein